MKRTLLSLLAVSAVCTASAVQTDLDQADRPRLVILSTENPLLPQRLRDEGVLDGECSVLVSVDSSGQLVDTLVTTYTNPHLGDACINALKKWKFAPPTFHGQAISIQREITFDFDSKGSFVVLDITAYMGVNNARVYGVRLTRPSTLKELDRIPTPLHTEHPVAPKGASGEATIEFYIDSAGAVRMPSVVSADTPELGDAAVATVRSWSFEPPTRQGLPVLTRVQQTFRFRS